MNQTIRYVGYFFLWGLGGNAMWHLARGDYGWVALDLFGAAVWALALVTDDRRARSHA